MRFNFPTTRTKAFLQSQADRFIVIGAVQITYMYSKDGGDEDDDDDDNDRLYMAFRPETILRAFLSCRLHATQNFSKTYDDSKLSNSFCKLVISGI